MSKKTKYKMTGVLFAGGKSSRMGKNKAFLEKEGVSLAERSLAVLDSVFEEVLVSSNSPELFERFGVPVIEDIFPDKGPMGGLYSVLKLAKYDYVFIMACDMPNVSSEGIQFLIDKIGNEDIVVPSVLGRLHPLHAFYHKRITEEVENRLMKERLKIAELIENCNAKIVQGMSNEILVNANTPEEWAMIIHP